MYNANSRLNKEFKEIAASKDAGITAVMIDGQLTHWKGSITGPVCDFIEVLFLPPFFEFS